MAWRGFGWALLAWAAMVCPSAGADLSLRKAPEAKADDAFDAEFQSLVTSDYVYRGVSLSARKPSAAVSIQASWRGFYLAANWQSVDLPTQPASEITWSGGYGWSMLTFNFDIGASYFWYPGEILADGAASTSYWEYAFKVDREMIKDVLTLKAMLGYSPNVAGTGAWGTYSEVGAEIVLPKLLPALEWRFSAGVGYWRFGDTAPAVGGFPLPAYANWHVGLEFTLKKDLLLDLNYVDSNLSREDCFVFTGDPMATPGGVADPISNPGGLRSRLCGAALVGTLTAKFDLSDLNRRRN